MRPPIAESRHAGASWPLALVLAVFVIVNVVTLTRVPFPWVDEVLMGEPAINLATSGRMTSAAWHNSAKEEIWASPQPLHILYLAACLRVFGVSQTTARSATIFLAGAAALLICGTARRLRIVKTSVGGAWLFALVVCDFGFAVSFKSARPEALAVFTCAVMFYSFTLKPAVRRMLLFFCALLIPSIGLQVVAFVLLLGFSLALWFRGRFLLEAALVLCGLAAGVVCFRAAYVSLGIWPNFLHELQYNGNTGLAARVWQRLTTNPLRDHSHNIPKDWTLLPLALAMGVTTFKLWRQRALALSSLGMLGLLLAFVIPVGLYLGVRFSTYYSWMAAVPLAVVYNAIWSRSDFSRSRRLVMALQAAACLVGLPLQAAAALQDWSSRDPATVARFVRAEILPDDVLFCDHTAYFPAKQRARQVYLPMYLQRITPAEAESITVAIVSLHPTPPLMMTKEQQLAQLGGEWAKVGEFRSREDSVFGNDWQLGFLSAPNYMLDVYRRAPPPVAATEKQPNE